MSPGFYPIEDFSYGCFINRASRRMIGLDDRISIQILETEISGTYIESLCILEPIFCLFDTINLSLSEHYNANIPLEKLT